MKLTMSPKALTIDLDLITVQDLINIGKEHECYIDGGNFRLVVRCVK